VRYLILSDIHANWEALQAVRAHVRRKRFDRVVFLGDAVGYGASPNRVLEWLRTLGSGLMAVRGNHDRVCAGLDSAEYFNRYARQAAEWTLSRLEERNLEYLQSFPEGPIELEEGVAICHGSSVDEDAYVFSAYDAQLAFAGMPHPVIFFGHTHVPSLFMLRVNRETATRGPPTPFSTAISVGCTSTGSPTGLPCPGGESSAQACHRCSATAFSMEREA
jgi:predicted phosphodiesterase